MDTKDKKLVRAFLPEPDHRRFKAQAALAGMELQDYVALAIMERVQRDEAAQRERQQQEDKDGE